MLIYSMELELENNPTIIATVQTILILRTKLWQAYKYLEAIMRQKSWVQWLKLGDVNTKFFHLVTSNRRRKNSITRLSVDGRILTELVEIKSAIYQHFKYQFQATEKDRPLLSRKGFRSLNEMQKEMLEKPFSQGEVELELGSCDGSKSPGPDGFTIKLIRSKWDLVKDDFMSFLEDFHTTGSIHAGIDFSFIALILEKPNPVNISDYRPISLLGCVYKLLSNVLAVRLKGVLPFIVGEAQMAFIK